MSSGYTVNSDALEYRAESWRDLSGLMRDSQSDLDGAPAGSFPPSVVGAARTFLSTWSSSAGESSEMAESYADALLATRSSYLTADSSADDAFSGLDSRLGPAT